MITLTFYDMNGRKAKSTSASYGTTEQAKADVKKLVQELRQKLYRANGWGTLTGKPTQTGDTLILTFEPIIAFYKKLHYTIKANCNGFFDALDSVDF